jgi:Zn-dependent protease with chaperone function
MPTGAAGFDAGRAGGYPSGVPSLPTSWPATATHPGLGGFDVAGEASLTTADFVFDGGEQRVAIPQRRLQFFRADGGRLVFHDPEQEGWEITLPGEDILRHPAFARLPGLVRQVRELRAGAEGRRTLRLCAVFLGVFALLAAAFMAAGPLAVRLAVNRVPVALEAKLGEMAMKTHFEERQFTEDHDAWDRLAAATNALRPVLARAGWPWRFYVVQHAQPRGMAFPGGHIVVSTGLLNWVETPEELAGVLAHEIAHVTRRHGLQQAVASQGPLLALQLVVGDQEVVAELLESSVALAALSFSRDQEREADALGFQLLADAGVDPRGLLLFFVRIEEAERGARATFHRALGRTADELGAPADRFSTHPLTGERIENMEALWEKLPRKERFQPLRWPEGAAPPETP